MMQAAAPLPKLSRIPPDIAAVMDYESYARARMDAGAWAYINGGAADEWTLQENRAAFQRIRLRSRVLRDLSGGHTRLRLLGQDFAHPILLAPVAYHRLAHPDGELATLLGATAMQAGMVVSTQASITLEEIAARAVADDRAASPPLWFQLYIQPDRDFTLALVRRAEVAGYGALVLTVDAPVNGLRNAEQRTGFALPADIQAANLRGMRPLQLAQAPPGKQAQAGEGVLLGGALMAAAATWRDLAWLRDQTRLPLLVKGITSAEDAVLAMQHGVDGIIVSNHGGRMLDGLPASIDLLPDIVAAVSNRVPVLLDGGIRRGSDAFKALALGAKAVLVGRGYMHGLAAAGAVGVSHVLHMLRAELELTMALTGCRDLTAIGNDCLI